MTGPRAAGLNAAVSKVVHDAIAAAGLSLDTVGERAGILHASLVRKLAGRSAFTIGELLAIAPLLDVSAMTLISRAGYREPTTATTPHPDHTRAEVGA